MNQGPQKRRLRERAKIGLRALAREMGISAPYLIDLERGHRSFSAELQERHTEALTKLTTKNPALAKA